MPVELGIPEFPHEELPGGITCRHKPWNGVLVRVDRIPFEAGDGLAFDVTVCNDAHGRIPAATIRHVVDITADTTTVDYTIPIDSAADSSLAGSRPDGRTARPDRPTR
ncbi:hypothetical protein ACFQ6N_06705 [Kitasatospora sp. NPDC056446]|uniref:hypothetical protein n=1 Tax=Kitasatospora sp. NPDC056446 TaxID=3345819 RepID=UPI003677B7DC